MQKTLAMKLLEGKKVPYQFIPYPATMRDAEEIAEHLQVPADQLYKTLVVLPPKGKPILIMIAANRRLALKKLAKALNIKKLKMAAHNEAERLTGLQVGGISALALLNKGFVIYLDEHARQYEEIYVSGGQRGVDLKLKVNGLMRVTKARWVDGSEPA